MPANCAEISKVTSSGRNWILRDLEPPEAKAFDWKYSSCIRLWNTIMKNWFHHHLDNFISFPLIYRFAGIRHVLTELEAKNWKHCSNYTVTYIYLSHYFISNLYDVNFVHGLRPLTFWLHYCRGCNVVLYCKCYEDQQISQCDWLSNTNSLL